jgi:hypothetical protein
MAAESYKRDVQLWPVRTLREANVALIDCDHRTPPAQEEGYPYVTIPQLKNGRIELLNARRISREHYFEWTRKAKPSAYDVVLSRRCNPGETAFVPPDVEFALGQNLVVKGGLPKRFGSWHTIYTRMNRWPKSGVLDQVFELLQREQIVRIKIEAVKMDSTIVKVHPDGTGALEKTAPKPSENPAADGPPRFIWLPRMLERL